METYHEYENWTTEQIREMIRNLEKTRSRGRTMRTRLTNTIKIKGMTRELQRREGK